MTESESVWTEPSGMVNFPGISERVLDLESKDQLLILVQPLNYLWLWVTLFVFHSPRFFLSGLFALLHTGQQVLHGRKLVCFREEGGTHGKGKGPDMLRGQ